MSAEFEETILRATKYDILLKYLLIGDSGTGKTTLINRFVENEYNPTIRLTIGIDFKIAKLAIGKTRVKLQIWDTSGNERYSGESSMFYREVAVVFYCYDVTDQKSFRNLDYWVNRINTTVQTKDLIQVLVGCKCDSPPDSRKISKEEAQAYAIMKKFYYFETDSKSGFGIAKMFDDVTERVLFQRRKRCKEEVETSREMRIQRSASPPSTASIENNPFAHRRRKSVSKSFKDWSRRSSRNIRSSFRNSFVKESSTDVPVHERRKLSDNPTSTKCQIS